MRIAVVIPAFNEEKRIGETVRGISALYPEYQIVVIDDGSADRTVLKAKEAGAQVLQHLINRGQGAALQTGTTYALNQGADIIVHFDADGQFEAKEIEVMLQPVLKGEADVVLGSRFLSQKNSVPWSKKKIILPLGRLVNFLFTGCWLSDAHNGFRVLTYRAALVLDLKQDRMAHNSEIIRFIAENKLPFVEKGITVFYHHYGQRFSGGLKIIKDLLLAKFL